jgi:hypothetical protein
MSKPIDALCPECGEQVDDATGIMGAKGRPKPGDLALCIRCSTPAFYVDNGETLGLRQPTDAEKVELSEDEEVQRARTMIQRVSGVWTQ